MSTENEGSVVAMRQYADSLKQQLDAVEQSLTIQVSRLDGTQVAQTLSLAENSLGVSAEDMRTEAREVILDAKLKDHDHESLSKNRTEPESLREWFAALASGKLAIALASGAGAVASRVGMIALIGGLIGLSAQIGDPESLVNRAKSVELSLLGAAAEADIANAVAVLKPEEDTVETSDCNNAPSDCADDTTAYAHLRTAFRTQAIRSLQRDIALQANTQPRRLRRSAFQLGAVDTRRAILAQAQRPAAPSLDPRAPPERYHVSVSEAPIPTTTNDVLDEAFERRVRTLRAHEPTWHRVRMWAVQPVSADAAGEAWLRTVVGDTGKARYHTLQVWSEHISSEFAQTVARTGDPQAGLNSVSNRKGQYIDDIQSLRDRKLFRDFAVEAPARTQAQVANFDSGLNDPGSLRRASRSGVTPGTVPPSMYDNLFPAVAEAASSGSSSGTGKPSGSAKPNRVSARSYSRVRFSGRVGGVVFGRPPEDGGDVVVVNDLSWLIKDNMIRLIVTKADGASVELGPFHPAIVHHALAYAADGRVVVSTLPKPFDHPDSVVSVPARRVVVHPAFEDTAFACSAIQVDRFVDTFSYVNNEDDTNEVLDEISEARNAVNYLSVLLSTGKDDISLSELDQLISMIQQYAKTCTDDSQCFPLAQYEKLGFDFGSTKQFLSCLRQQDDLAQQGTCWNYVNSAPSQHSYSVDSGVREAPYRIDASLDFITGARNSTDELWPLEFIVQAVPVTADGTDLAIDELAEDQDPWQFPAIENSIASAVSAGISNDEGAQQILKNSQEFVVAQRLFRAAMSGDFGDDFPLHQLVELSTDTRPYVKVHRHERWNVNQSFVEFLISVQNWSYTELTEASSGIAGTACQAAVSKVLNLQEEAQWPPQMAFWEFMMEAESVCGEEIALQSMTNLQQDLRRQQIFDEVISLSTPQVQRKTQFHCDPL